CTDLCADIGIGVIVVHGAAQRMKLAEARFAKDGGDDLRGFFAKTDRLSQHSLARLTHTTRPQKYGGSLWHVTREASGNHMVHVAEHESTLEPGQQVDRLGRQSQCLLVSALRRGD